MHYSSHDKKGYVSVTLSLGTPMMHCTICMNAYKTEQLVIGRNWVKLSVKQLQVLYDKMYSA